MTEARFTGNTVRYRDDAHPRQRFLTPQYVLDPVRESLGGVISLDPCTEPDNPTGAKTFYTASDDGLKMPWVAATIFVNPPYSRAREPWVIKCVEAAISSRSLVILLMPSHTDTRCWQAAAESADSICFIQGRVKFGVPRANGRQYAASHPSCLIGWNTQMTACRNLGFLVDVNPTGL